MKRIFKIALIAIALIFVLAPISNAKTKKSRSSTSKTPSIEAIYNACEHGNEKQMKAIGLRKLYDKSGEYGGDGYYEDEVYGINVKVTKHSKGLKFTSTGPHAFYHHFENNGTPTGLAFSFIHYGFKNKDDCDKFRKLLLRDRKDYQIRDGENYDIFIENGWYTISIRI